MTAKWAVTPLGDLCDPVRGITYGIVKVGDFDPVGVPVIRGGDIRDGRIVFDGNKRVTEAVSQQFHRTILRGGEIVINLISEPGHTAIVPPHLAGANVSRDVGVIPLMDIVNHRFVDFFLKSRTANVWLTSRMQGSVTQKINIGTLRELPVPTPPISQQNAIASVLATLDDKIEINLRVNETLEAMARAVFKDWFVDFGPTRAKLAGRSPYLAPEIWALFPDRLDEDGKPINWPALPLGAFFRLVRGLSYKGEFLRQGGVPMINLGCFQGGGRFDASKLKAYSGEYKPRHVVSSGTLVIANTDMTQNRVILGSPHVVGDEGDELIFSHHVYAARPLNDEARARTRFFYFHLLRPEFRERAEGFASGTTVLFLPVDAAANCRFPIPGQELNTAFLDVVDPLLKRISLNNKQNRALASARDSLLPKLMSGEISACRLQETVGAVG